MKTFEERQAEWIQDDLSHARGPKMSEGNTPLPMRGKLVLRGAVRLIVPFVLLFGLYVQMHGDYGPGGGFQAGVIFATAFILFGLIFGAELSEIVFPPRWAERFLAMGVLLYAGVGVAAMLVGDEFLFLDYDFLGSSGQHYGIVLVELGVGLTVASAMVRLYYAFADLSEVSAAAEGVLDDVTPLSEQKTASEVEDAGDHR